MRYKDIVVLTNMDNMWRDLESLKLIQLYQLAKKQKIKYYHYLRKKDLIYALQNPNADISALYVGMCEHGVIKHHCSRCKGNQICTHRIQRTHCKKCKGGAICKHNRERYTCKMCGGKGICCHGITKAMCLKCIDAVS